MRRDMSDKALACKGRTVSYWGKKMAADKGPESLGLQDSPRGI